MNSVEPISFILTFLLGGTVVLGLFIILLLLRSDLGLAKWLISLSLFALLLHLLTFLLFTTELIKAWPHLLGVGTPVLFLTGPACYFFIRSYAEPKFQFRPFHLVHMIPFLAILINQIQTVYLKGLSAKQEIINYYYELIPQGNLSWFEWLYFNLYVLLILFYVIAALNYIYKKDPYNAVLMKRFCWLFLALSLVYLVLQSGFLITGASLITSEIILSGLLAVVVLLMGYWIVDIRHILPPTRNKYQTSPLSQEQTSGIKQGLIKAMEADELYLNPRLKISNLAQALQVPSHHISQVMSNDMNTNFYQLVNHYRVEFSKDLLKSERLQQVSIQAIGLECGFSNKTSFYRAFKKHTGMTPTEFVDV